MYVRTCDARPLSIIVQRGASDNNDNTSNTNNSIMCIYIYIYTSLNSLIVHRGVPTPTLGERT